MSALRRNAKGLRGFRSVDLGEHAALNFFTGAVQNVRNCRPSPFENAARWTNGRSGEAAQSA